MQKWFLLVKMQIGKFQLRKINHRLVKRNQQFQECLNKISFCLTKITSSKNLNPIITHFFLPKNKSNLQFRLHYSNNCKRSSITMPTLKEVQSGKKVKDMKKSQHRLWPNKKADCKESTWRFNNNWKSNNKYKNLKLKTNEGKHKIHLWVTTGLTKGLCLEEIVRVSQHWFQRKQESRSVDTNQTT